MNEFTRQESFSRFGKRFQENICQLMLEDRPFYDQITEVLDLNFFEKKYLQIFAQTLINYREKYNTHPNSEVMMALLRTELNNHDKATAKLVREFYARIHTSEGVEEALYVKDKAIDFCRKQALKGAMLKSAKLLNTSSFDEIEKVIKDALVLGTDNNFGHDFRKDLLKRFELAVRNPITTGWARMDEICKGGLGKSELGVVVAPTGCHAKGTKVMLANGNLELVENIKVGDRLKGPEKSFRTVLQLCRGREMMYEIQPTKGKSFVVNGEHILSLVRTNDGTSKAGEVVNLSVNEYLQKSKTFKHIHKLYRSDVVHFENSKNVRLAYFVGLMLGDGSICNENIRFTSEDEELLSEVSRIAEEKFGLKATRYLKEGGKATDLALVNPRRGMRNEMGRFFEEIGLRGTRSGDKFIPNEYKTAAIGHRMEILAGLLDADGSLSNNGYDYISKSKQLAEDVAFVARSLGLAAYVKECEKSCGDFVGTYYRVSISGETDIIPCRLERKTAKPRKQVKNVLRTGFKVKQLEEDDFYGFTLDGDHLYLMDDFTVTHNSGKSMVLVHLATQALLQGKTVVYYTLELKDTVVGQRFDCCITDVPLQDHKERKTEIINKIKDISGTLIIKEYPTKSASVQTLKNHIEKLRKRGIEPDMVLVDYADLLRPSRSTGEKRHELEETYEGLRGLAQSYEIPVWTASQTNRGGLNAEVITMEAISEAFNKCFVADFIFSLSRTVQDKQANKGRLFIAKNRNGPDGLVFDAFVDWSDVTIKVLDRDESAEKMQSTTDALSILKEKYSQISAK
jgi:replicative DNA helicase